MEETWVTYTYDFEYVYGIGKVVGDSDRGLGEFVKVECDNGVVQDWESSYVEVKDGFLDAVRSYVENPPEGARVSRIKERLQYYFGESSSEIERICSEVAGSR